MNCCIILLFFLLCGQNGLGCNNHASNLKGNSCQGAKAGRCNEKECREERDRDRECGCSCNEGRFEPRFEPRPFSGSTCGCEEK